MSVRKKVQSIRSSRLAGYRQHVYKCLVLLFYYIDLDEFSIFLIDLSLTVENVKLEILDGGEGEGSPNLNFWFKSSNFMAACLF